MKLQADARFAVHAISAHGPGYVTVGNQRITRTCLLRPDGIDATWGPDNFANLTEEHFAALAAVECDVLLLGTGGHQHFPTPAQMRPLLEARRGIEVMSTAAACRTYNVVLAEGRIVAAALFVE